MDSVRLALGALETQLGAVAKVKSLEMVSGLLYRIAPQDLKRMLVVYDAYLESVDALGLDFAVLSPVKATGSHPDETPLGWQAFNTLSDICFNASSSFILYSLANSIGSV